MSVTPDLVFHALAIVSLRLCMLQFAGVSLFDKHDLLRYPSPNELCAVEALQVASDQ